MIVRKYFRIREYSGYKKPPVIYHIILQRLAKIKNIDIGHISYDGHCLFPEPMSFVVESRGPKGRTERPFRVEYTFYNRQSRRNAFRKAIHDLLHRQSENSIWTTRGPLKLIKPGKPFTELPN